MLDQKLKKKSDFYTPVEGTFRDKLTNNTILVFTFWMCLNMCENGIAVSYLRNFKVIWDVVHSLQHGKLNPFKFLRFALHLSQPCMVEFTILRFIWSGKHFYPVVESFSCNFDSRDKVYIIFRWGYWICWYCCMVVPI